MIHIVQSNSSYKHQQRTQNKSPWISTTLLTLFLKMEKKKSVFDDQYEPFHYKEGTH